jgi:hypothetical protein
MFMAGSLKKCVRFKTRMNGLFIINSAQQLVHWTDCQGYSRFGNAPQNTGVWQDDNAWLLETTPDSYRCKQADRALNISCGPLRTKERDK